MYSSLINQSVCVAPLKTHKHYIRLHYLIFKVSVGLSYFYDLRVTITSDNEYIMTVILRCSFKTTCSGRLDLYWPLVLQLKIILVID